MGPSCAEAPGEVQLRTGRLPGGAPAAVHHVRATAARQRRLAAALRRRRLAQRPPPGQLTLLCRAHLMLYGARLTRLGWMPSCSAMLASADGRHCAERARRTRLVLLSPAAAPCELRLTADTVVSGSVCRSRLVYILLGCSAGRLRATAAQVGAPACMLGAEVLPVHEHAHGLCMDVCKPLPASAAWCWGRCLARSGRTPTYALVAKPRLLLLHA